MCSCNVLFSAAIQLERNHDKLMQKERKALNERFATFVHIFRVRMMSGAPCSLNHGENMSKQQNICMNPLERPFPLIS